jgi:predicted nucleic acid-binding protein
VKSVLLDTGPLVALLDKRDAHHSWAAREIRLVMPPLLTCDAVLTTTLHLLRGSRKARRQLRDWLAQGVIRTVFSATDDAPLLLELMDRYTSVPMSFADACLVRMSELIPAGTVFTTDSDFRIYRRHKRQTIPLLIPD